MDITVKVLTSCYWPTQVALDCILPQAVAQSFDSYKAFYLAKHSGRKLNFNPMLGHADVKAIFYGGNATMDELSQQVFIIY